MKRTALSVLLMSFLTPAVQAGNSNAFSSITGLIQDMVIALGQLADFGASNQIYAFKLILFFLFFTVFYVGARTVFDGKGRDNGNKIASTISILISLAAVIVIPDMVVRYVMETFGGILVAILLVLLNAIPIWFMFSSKGGLPSFIDSKRLIAGMRLFISVFVLFLLQIMQGAFGITAGQTQVQPGQGAGIGGALAEPILNIIGTLNGFLLAFYAVVIFMSIYGLFSGGKSSGRSVSNGSNGGSGSMGSAVKSALGMDDQTLLNEEVKQNVKDVETSLSQGQDVIDYIEEELRKIKNKTGAIGDDPKASEIAGHFDNIRKQVLGEGSRKTLKEDVESILQELERIEQGTAQDKKECGNLKQALADTQDWLDNNEQVIRDAHKGYGTDDADVDRGFLIEAYTLVDDSLEPVNQEIRDDLDTLDETVSAMRKSVDEFTNLITSVSQDMAQVVRDTDMDPDEKRKRVNNAMYTIQSELAELVKGPSNTDGLDYLKKLASKLKQDESKYTQKVMDVNGVLNSMNQPGQKQGSTTKSPHEKLKSKLQSKTFDRNRPLKNTLQILS